MRRERFLETEKEENHWSQQINLAEWLMLIEVKELKSYSIPIDSLSLEFIFKWF